jgi:hypothetical protein
VDGWNKYGLLHDIDYLLCFFLLSLLTEESHCWKVSFEVKIPMTMKTTAPWNVMPGLVNIYHYFYGMFCCCLGSKRASGKWLLYYTETGLGPTWDGATNMNKCTEGRRKGRGKMHEGMNFLLSTFLSSYIFHCPLATAPGVLVTFSYWHIHSSGHVSVLLSFSMLDLLFCPNDGNGTFLQNVSNDLSHYTTLHPKRQ